MTFNAAVPLNSDSPSIFPSQNQTNMARLQTLLGADHQFNLSAAADDGYHNLIHMSQQAPSGALAATGRYYAKSSAGRIHAFYMDDTGAEYQVSPTMPIRAAVNFAGNGGIGAAPIRSQFNISGVNHDATGLYTITFSTAMPNTDYIVIATGMRTGSSNAVFGCVTSDNTYTNSVSTALVKVSFFQEQGTPRDVVMGNVAILSVT
mgnify:CR=1 FL=1